MEVTQVVGGKRTPLSAYDLIVTSIYTAKFF